MRALWPFKSTTESDMTGKLLEMGHLNATGKGYENVQTTDMYDDNNSTHDQFSVSIDTEDEEMRNRAQGEMKVKRSKRYLDRQKEREKARRLEEGLYKVARLTIWWKILVVVVLAVFVVVLVCVFGTKNKRELKISKGWE
jgi:cell division protein FtsX